MSPKKITQFLFDFRLYYMNVWGRRRSLGLGGGLSPGLFQVPKERLPAYARGRDFERTRNPLLFPLVMLIVDEALEKVPVAL
jgi:hypothetical protein